MTRVARPDNSNMFSSSSSKNRRWFMVGCGILLVGLVLWKSKTSTVDKSAATAAAGGGGVKVADLSVSKSTAEGSSSFGTSSPGTEVFYESEMNVQMHGNSVAVPYYHCNPQVIDDNSKDTKTIIYHNLVLLHGSRFTKEDWKTSGILESFCRFNTLSVSAMDLPVSANHESLMDMIQTMKKKNLLVRTNGRNSISGNDNDFDVTLVTPSASGKTMTDWIKSSSTMIAELPNYINHWVPVAPYSVASLRDDDLSRLKQLTTLPSSSSSPSFSILAVNGNKDKKGVEVSNVLQSQANAKVKVLTGGHPCYLDSPVAFVNTIIEYLSVQQ